MSEYGLPSLRKDGELQPVDHTYVYGDEEITIKLRPPTIGEQEQYEELGQDAETEDLEEIVRRHLVKPEIPEDQELATRELFCYLEGIKDFSFGGNTGLAEAVQAELEKRREAQEGN